jgi:hypothetical protein
VSVSSMGALRHGGRWESGHVRVGIGMRCIPAYATIAATACYRLLAQTPSTPRALLATAQWASRTEDHSGSTLSWCRSRARVHGGPRANSSPMRIETQRGTGPGRLVVVVCLQGLR